MATQKFYGEQAPRQIGQPNLKWGGAKFLTSPQVARTLQVSETRVLGWLNDGNMSVACKEKEDLLLSLK